MRELHQGQKDSNPSITGRIYGSNPVTVSPTLGLAYPEETIYGLLYRRYCDKVFVIKDTVFAGMMLVNERETTDYY